MLDLETEFPDLETYQETLNRCLSNIRDSLADIENLYRRLINGQIYLTEEEVLKMLHLETVPERLRKLRFYIGRNSLYKMSDITNFIESCRRSKC